MVSPGTRWYIAYVLQTAGLTTQELVPRVITPTAGTRDPMLTAGSERYNFGMRWSGGDKYNVVAYVGRGAFANVYKLATKREGEVFAVKELEKRRFIKDGILDVKFNNELDIMKKLDHVCLNSKYCGIPLTLCRPATHCQILRL